MLDLLIPEFSPRRRTPPPAPFVESAPGFFDYLRDERGLKEASIQLYGHNLWLKQANQRFERFAAPVLQEACR